MGSSATTLAVLLNACYSTLMDERQRALYDVDLAHFARLGGGFDGRPMSGWLGPESETRAVFVSETECIGCRQCTVAASKTFFMEEEHGRARVGNQW